MLTLLACSTHLAPVRTGPAPDPVRVELDGEGELRVTRLVHASVLIELGGERILTDPWFTEKVGYHPGEPLGMDPDALGELTGVVVSHGHYDHFDVEALAATIDLDTPLVVKRGDGDAARDLGFTSVTELDPWEDARLGAVRVTAAPAEHGVPENSYVLEAAGWTVFFGGDTKLLEAHREVAQRWPDVDLALLPVNGLSAVGHQEVMNAEEAAELAGWLGADVVVPIHYRFHGSWFTDTFILGYDGDPERFVAAVPPSTRAVVLEPGQPLIAGR